MNKIFSISTPPDFNFKECLRFLQRSNQEYLFFIEKDKIRFALEIENRVFLLLVFFQNQTLKVEVIKGRLTAKRQSEISEYISDWLDLNTDLEAFYAIAKEDKVLKNVVGKFKGLPLIGIPNLVEAISWAIIGQQINLTFAYSLKKRLIENYGQTINYKNQSFYLFPTAITIAQLGEEDLRPHQFSRSKIKYLSIAASAIANKEITKEGLAQLSYENAKEKLVALKGIGNWSADYVLMKCFRHADAFPIADVGLHNAIKKELNLDRKPSMEELQEMSKNWGKWSAYATFYLWHSLLP